MIAKPLSKAFILSIHQRQLYLFDGLPGIRDDGMLDPSLAQPFSTFAENDLYPSIEEKAAVKMILGVASGEKSYEDLVKFIQLEANYQQPN